MLLYLNANKLNKFLATSFISETVKQSLKLKSGTSNTLAGSIGFSGTPRPSMFTT